MKTWKNRIYVNVLAEGEHVRDILEAKQLGVTRVFRLFQTGDAGAISSGYKRHGTDTAVEDSAPLRYMDVPVPPFTDPQSRTAHELWECAFAAAASVSEGNAILIQAADEGHASVFACAILVILGYTARAALDEIAEDRFALPADEQVAFVNAGIPAPIMQTMPPKDTLDRSDRIHHGPNDNCREEWLSLERMRCSHRSLQRCGMRSITDPFSGRWQCSSGPEKLQAFASLAQGLLARQDDLTHRINPANLTSLVGGDLLATGSYGSVQSPDTLLFRSMLFAQGVFTPEYGIPVSRHTVDAEYEECERLKQEDAVRAAEQMYQEGGIGPLPLDHTVLDPLSHQAQRAELSERLAAIKAVAGCRPSLKAAIMIYRYRHCDSSSEFDTRSLAKVVLSLAAVGAVRVMDRNGSVRWSAEK